MCRDIYADIFVCVKCDTVLHEVRLPSNQQFIVIVVMVGARSAEVQHGRRNSLDTRWSLRSTGVYRHITEQLCRRRSAVRGENQRNALTLVAADR